jgi:hypothetical protein
MLGYEQILVIFFDILVLRVQRKIQIHLFLFYAAAGLPDGMFSDQKPQFG